jgi:hypothetical protein
VVAVVIDEKKRAFVIEFLRRNRHADVLNRPFMLAYIEKFSPKKWTETMYGAPRCPEVGRLLSSMAKGGILKKSATGLSGMEAGFPNWIYVYSLQPWVAE